jgi:hypothetical protein
MYIRVLQFDKRCRAIICWFPCEPTWIYFPGDQHIFVTTKEGVVYFEVTNHLSGCLFYVQSDTLYIWVPRAVWVTDVTTSHPNYPLHMRSSQLNVPQSHNLERNNRTNQHARRRGASLSHVTRRHTELYGKAQHTRQGGTNVWNIRSEHNKGHPSVHRASFLSGRVSHSAKRKEKNICSQPTREERVHSSKS